MPLKHYVTHHQVAGDYDNTAKHHWETNPVKWLNVIDEYEVKRKLTRS